MNHSAAKGDALGAGSSSFARARALKLLSDRKGTRGRWLGITGGEHIFRARDGRVFSVDLVVNKVTLCVGLMPHEWRHPPRDEQGGVVSSGSDQ